MKSVLFIVRFTGSGDGGGVGNVSYEKHGN